MFGVVRSPGASRASCAQGRRDRPCLADLRDPGRPGAAFAVVAGVLDPSRLTPAKLVDALEGRDGLHPGFRRAHAKGVCFTGRFEASGAGAQLSRASVFAQGEVPVIGRFSTGGGMPYAPDGRVALPQHGPQLLAARRRAMAHRHEPHPCVSGRDARGVPRFSARHLARRGHGEAGRRARGGLPLRPPGDARLHGPAARRSDLPSSFANGTYHSVNAFRFTGGAGPARDVRWSMVPEAPLEALDKGTLASRPRASSSRRSSRASRVAAALGGCR